MTPIQSTNNNILFKEVTYLSDSVEIKGYLMYPDKEFSSQIPLLVFCSWGA